MATTHREGSVFHHDGEKVTHYETGTGPADAPPPEPVAEPAVVPVPEPAPEPTPEPSKPAKKK